MKLHQSVDKVPELPKIDLDNGYFCFSVFSIFFSVNSVSHDLDLP